MADVNIKQSIFNAADAVIDVVDKQKQDKLAFPGDESLFLNGARGFSKPPSGGSYTREQLISIIGTFNGATATTSGTAGLVIAPLNGKIGLVPSAPEVPVKISDMSWSEIAELATKVRAGKDKYQNLIGQTKSFAIGGSYNMTMTAEVVDLCHEDYGTDHGIVFLATASLGMIAWNSAGDTSTWATCSLRNTLQTTVLQALPADMQGVLKPMNVGYISTVSTSSFSGSSSERIQDYLTIPAAHELNQGSALHGYAAESKPFAKFADGPLAFSTYVCFRSLSKVWYGQNYYIAQDANAVSCSEWVITTPGPVYLVFCI